MTFLVLSIVKVSAVLCAAWLCAKAMHRAAASARHVLWTAALATSLLLPAVSALMPEWTTVPVPAVEIAAAPSPAVMTLPTPPVDKPFPWPILVAMTWAAGCVAFAVRTARSSARVSRMLRGGRSSTATPLSRELAAALGIARNVRVCESADSAVPMSWGVLRPVVILPSGATRWPESRLRSVLLHELAHVARLDALTQWLGQVACCVYWFHPLVWMAERKLRDERERACDDAVLRIGVAPTEYASHLLEVARGVPAGLGLAPAMAEISGLESRIRALLERGRNRGPLSRGVAIATLAGMVLVLVPIAAFRAQAQGASGSIAGVVKDASGAVVPFASVAVKNEAGTNQEAARADAVGEFRFAAIPAGRYSLEVQSAGFKLFRKTVNVESGQASRVDVILEVGQVSEKVVVTGKRPATVVPQSAGPPRRIRVGGNVQATKLIKMVRPAYPPNLEQLGIEGSVLMRAVISVDGSLLNLEVISTAVHPELAKAAKDAVSQWRYQPTLLNGQPVEVVTTITVEFQLER